MNHSSNFSTAFSICLLLSLAASTSNSPAAIMTTGSIEPDFETLPPKDWTFSSTNAFIGYEANGTLMITGGSEVESAVGHIGYPSGVRGAIHVTGFGSKWTNRRYVMIGEQGEGELTIASGGEVSSAIGTIANGAGSSGKVEVSGSEAKWKNGKAGYIGDLIIGNKGDGALVVQNGGLVENVMSGYIGIDPGSCGEAMVKGSGSEWTNGKNLYVAYGSTRRCTLKITGGGMVGNDHGYIGFESGSSGEAVVKGAGSEWANTNMLNIGYNGNGKLGVSGGGMASCGFSYIGYSTGSTGLVTVDGTDSTWTIDGGFYVGASGVGTLRILCGGEVASGRSSIAANSGSTGSARVAGAGSTWKVDGDLDVGYDGAGTLSIAEGGLVQVVGQLTIDKDFDGDGFINMASGGVLAVNGWNGGTPGGFLEIVRGANAIRYWNHAAGEWVGIFTATHGRQYTLTQGTGDLAGYTLLTVTPVAESDISLLAAGGTPNEIKIVLNTPDPENSKIQFSTDLKTWKPIADSPNFVRFDEEGPWNIAAIVTKNPGANEFYRGTTP